MAFTLQCNYLLRAFSSKLHILQGYDFAIYLFFSPPAHKLLVYIVINHGHMLYWSQGAPYKEVHVQVCSSSVS